MKIYFAASIRGGREDREIYFSLIQILKEHGTVLTEHFGHEPLSDQGDLDITVGDIYARDMNWVHEADVIVAEVTTPSLGVGYELGQAEALGKKTLCLYRPQEGKSLSAMVRGNAYFDIQEYSSIEEAGDIFRKFFDAFAVSA